MKPEDLESLKATVKKAARSGDVSALASPKVAQIVAGLVAHHEAVVRAEDFWGDRAPLLNDEVLALRPLELYARLIVNGDQLSVERLKGLADALAHLDDVRAAQAKKDDGGKAA